MKFVLYFCKIKARFRPSNAKQTNFYIKKLKTGIIVIILTSFKFRLTQ